MDKDLSLIRQDLQRMRTEFQSSLIRLEGRVDMLEEELEDRLMDIELKGERNLTQIQDDLRCLRSRFNGFMDTLAARGLAQLAARD